MIRLLLFSACVLGFLAGEGHAACSTFALKDGTGAAQTGASIADGSGNCIFPSTIADGTAGANRAAVKAASTAPLATDPALVVTMSPNAWGCGGVGVANTHSTPISLTASGQIIAGTASLQTYVCALNLVVSAADNVALVEGTGTVCATGIAGIAGGPTAATGWNFGPSGGLTQGDGRGMIMRTATAADNVCLLVSGAAQVSGSIIWAQF